MIKGKTLIAFGLGGELSVFYEIFKNIDEWPMRMVIFIFVFIQIFVIPLFVFGILKLRKEKSF